MRRTVMCLMAMVCAMSMWAQMTPWTEGAFTTGKYRNVFVDMGYKPAEVDAKLKEVFNDVFRGPNRIYFEVGDTMGYVSDIKNNDARTEGMSYGMMVAVQFGEKDIFDRLWRWSRRYMQHQSGDRTVSCTLLPPCYSPPTVGATIPASTIKQRHDASLTASSQGIMYI